MKSFGFVGMVVIVSVWASPLSANEWTGAASPPADPTQWGEPGNWSQNVVPLGAWQHPFAAGMIPPAPVIR